MKEFIYQTIEPARYSQEACGGDVRWNNGVLQQRFMITEYIGGSISGRRDEWRDVPVISTGERA